MSEAKKPIDPALVATLATGHCHVGHERHLAVALRSAWRRIAALEKAIREVEWGGMDVTCPWCEAYGDRGESHDSTCVVRTIKGKKGSNV